MMHWKIIGYGVAALAAIAISAAMMSGDGLTWPELGQVCAGVGLGVAIADALSRVVERLARRGR